MLGREREIKHSKTDSFDIKDEVNRKVIIREKCEMIIARVLHIVMIVFFLFCAFKPCFGFTQYFFSEELDDYSENYAFVFCLAISIIDIFIFFKIKRFLIFAFLCNIARAWLPYVGQVLLLYIFNRTLCGVNDHVVVGVYGRKCMVYGTLIVLLNIAEMILITGERQKNGCTG